jgi:hypothetical protein
VLGFLICLLLWWNLNSKARIFGAAWMAIGIAAGAWKTHGFRRDWVDFELPPEDAPTLGVSGRAARPSDGPA